MDVDVIYDPEREVAALVDGEEMRALGPVYVGPNAEAEMRSFVQAMPPTVLAELGSYGLAEASKEYWAREFAALHPSDATDTGAVEPPPHAGDEHAALAEHEAIESRGEPPAAAPHDTDMEADQGEAGQVADNGVEPAPEGDEPPPATRKEEQDCFACSGTGRVPGGTEGAPLVCNLCRGSGRVTMEVPA